MKFDWVHVDGWNWVKEAALTTIHKKSIAGKAITSEWKRSILKSEHSPIRELTIRFKISEIKRWIAGQLVRQKVGVEHYMGTMRSDRGNKPREQQTMADLTELMQSHNAQSFMALARTRLCVGCVSKETRELTQKLVDIIGEKEPELAFYCVPPCVHQAGCKESGFTNCGYFKKFLSSHSGSVIMNENRIFDIDKRYQAYHYWRKEIDRDKSEQNQENKSIKKDGESLSKC